MQIPPWSEQDKVCWNLSTDPHLHCDIFSALLWMTSYEYTDTLEEYFHPLCSHCCSGSISSIFLRKAYSNSTALQRNAWYNIFLFCASIHSCWCWETPNFQTCDIQQPEIQLDTSLRLAFSRQAFKSMFSNLNQQSSLNVCFYITTETEEVLKLLLYLEQRLVFPNPDSPYKGRGMIREHQQFT